MKKNLLDYISRASGFHLDCVTQSTCKGMFENYIPRYFYSKIPRYFYSKVPRYFAFFWCIVMPKNTQKLGILKVHPFIRFLNTKYSVIYLGATETVLFVNPVLNDTTEEKESV